MVESVRCIETVEVAGESSTERNRCDTDLISVFCVRYTQIRTKTLVGKPERKRPLGDTSSYAVG